MDLSVIIVSWNVRDKLRENLKALAASTGDFSYEIFVVDNDSHDGTAEMVRREFPEAKLIANDKNLGFAKANNQAILEAQGDFILLLNPDMRVEADTLDNSLAWAKNKQQAVVTGIRLAKEDGTIIPHVRRFPRLFDQLMVVLKVPHFLPHVLDGYLCSSFDYSHESKVDSIRGAYFMINRLRWEELSGEEKPFLDDRYFIWFEEVDFCRQVYSRGGEVWYTPAASCVDYIGQSFGQVKTGTKQRYFEESMIKYFEKWSNRLSVAALKAAWPIGRFLAKLFS